MASLRTTRKPSSGIG